MTITPEANRAAAISPFGTVYKIDADNIYTSTGTEYGQAHGYGSLEAAIEAARKDGFAVLTLTEVKGWQVEGDVTDVGQVGVVMSSALKEIKTNEYAGENNSMNCIVRSVSGVSFGVRETEAQIREMLEAGRNPQVLQAPQHSGGGCHLEYLPAR